MKHIIPILGCWIITGNSLAQPSKGIKDSDYFLLKGSVYEVNYLDETEGKAKDTQVIVMQDDEIYVAFNTAKGSGTYEFYLPINYNYNIYYGGEDYINKIVNIDSRQFPSEKKPRVVKMNVGVFKPIPGYSFEMMKSPYIMVKYNPETDTIEPDLEAIETKNEQVEKYFKKIRKDLGKKSKSSKEKELKTISS